MSQYLRSARYWATCAAGAAAFWGALFVALTGGRVLEIMMGVRL